MAPLGVWQNWWLNKEHDIYMCLVLCSVVWLKMWHPQSWEGVSAHSDISPHVYSVQCVHVYTAGAGLCQAPSDQGRCTWRQRRSGGRSREGETGNWDMWDMQTRGPGGCWAVGGGGGYSMSWQVWRNWWCDVLRPDTASPGNIIIEEVQRASSSKCLKFYN